MPRARSSQLPSLVAAGTITVVMMFFTDTLAYLPNAALAGIVANAVLSLIEVHELRELWKIRRSDFWIAMVCLLSVLVLGPLQAVIIAFLMATIDVVRRASKPGTWVLRETPDRSHLVPVEPGDAPDSSGLLVYRFGSSLYFANANLFMEEIEKLVVESPTPVRSFILDAEAIVDVDATGADAFREVLSLMSEHGVTFALSRANKPLIKLLANYHLLDKIGENRLYPTNRHAVAALRDEPGKEKRRHHRKGGQAVTADSRRGKALRLIPPMKTTRVKNAKLALTAPCTLRQESDFSMTPV